FVDIAFQKYDQQDPNLHSFICGTTATVIPCANFEIREETQNPYEKLTLEVLLPDKENCDQLEKAFRHQVKGSLTRNFEGFKEFTKPAPEVHVIPLQKTETRWNALDHIWRPTDDCKTLDAKKIY
ncbi:hypothetical protein BGZ46_003414, partial [Entomortierella lignicola]